MSADIRAGRFPDGICAHCRDYRHPELGDLRPQVRSLYDEYPLKMESPFEEVENISGGVWRASEILGGDDALLRLHFQKRTLDLPLHSHDYSDRVIFVTEGRGEFEYFADSRERELNSIEVETGDVLVFSRGTVHSFRTSEDDLQLLSYHSPYIELSHHRQFTLLH
ncbi:cupin domain-containing protein [Stieleria sedimenti]|uniref:cupin domain-containing protein n=1 Tax=Stieleria sedimenti TaxID=2976331 RepID=UPI00217F7975|nr:cupin domain-containing protein [Stieleria sedimenti]